MKRSTAVPAGELGISEADMPAKPKAKTAKRLIDRKKTGFMEENSEFREAAADLAEGDYYDEISINDAQRLALLVEKCHGPRTASIRKRNGLYAVIRVSNRPERKRKAKAADGPVQEHQIIAHLGPLRVLIPAPEIYSQMGDVDEPKEAD